MNEFVWVLYSFQCIRWLDHNSVPGECRGEVRWEGVVWNWDIKLRLGCSCVCVSYRVRVGVSVRV